MSKQQYIQDLQSSLDAYKYFESERLKMLKCSLDLQIVLGDLQDIGNSEIHDLILSAKENYNTMFTRYEQSLIALTQFKIETLGLIEYVKDLEKQLKTIDE